MVTLTENGERWRCLQLAKCARAFAVSQESKDSIIDAGRQRPKLGSHILEDFIERMVTCSIGTARVEYNS